MGNRYKDKMRNPFNHKEEWKARNQNEKIFFCITFNFLCINC